MTATTSSRWHLRRINLPRSGPASNISIISLDKDVVKFGRNPDQVDIVLNSDFYNNMISREHAEIRRQRNVDGTLSFVLIDRSLNGTYVNSYRAKGPILLHPNDVINFGHINGAAIEAGAAAPQPDAEFTFVFEKSSSRSPPPNIEQSSAAAMALGSSAAASSAGNVHLQQSGYSQANPASQLNPYGFPGGGHPTLISQIGLAAAYGSHPAYLGGINPFFQTPPTMHAVGSNASGPLRDPQAIGDGVGWMYGNQMVHRLQQGVGGPATTTAGIRYPAASHQTQLDISNASAFRNAFPGALGPGGLLGVSAGHVAQQQQQHMQQQQLQNMQRAAVPQQPSLRPSVSQAQQQQQLLRSHAPSALPASFLTPNLSPSQQAMLLQQQHQQQQAAAIQQQQRAAVAQSQQAALLAHQQQQRNAISAANANLQQAGFQAPFGLSAPQAASQTGLSSCSKAASSSAQAEGSGGFGSRGVANSPQRPQPQMQPLPAVQQTVLQHAVSGAEKHAFAAMQCQERAEPQMSALASVSKLGVLSQLSRSGSPPLTAASHLSPRKPVDETVANTSASLVSNNAKESVPVPAVSSEPTSMKMECDSSVPSPPNGKEKLPIVEIDDSQAINKELVNLAKKIVAPVSPDDEEMFDLGNDSDKDDNKKKRVATVDPDVRQQPAKTSLSGTSLVGSNTKPVAVQMQQQLSVPRHDAGESFRSHSRSSGSNRGRKRKSNEVARLLDDISGSCFMYNIRKKSGEITPSSSDDSDESESEEEHDEKRSKKVTKSKPNSRVVDKRPKPSDSKSSAEASPVAVPTKSSSSATSAKASVSKQSIVSSIPSDSSSSEDSSKEEEDEKAKSSSSDEHNNENSSDSSNSSDDAPLSDSRNNKPLQKPRVKLSRRQRKPSKGNAAASARRAPPGKAPAHSIEERSSAFGRAGRGKAAGRGRGRLSSRSSQGSRQQGVPPASTGRAKKSAKAKNAKRKRKASDDSSSSSVSSSESEDGSNDSSSANDDWQQNASKSASVVRRSNKPKVVATPSVVEKSAYHTPKAGRGVQRGRGVGSGATRGRKSNKPKEASHRKSAFDDPLLPDTSITPLVLPGTLHNPLEACAAKNNCKKPEEENVDWVQCDDCQGWYHANCVTCDFDAIQNEDAPFHCGCED